MTAKIRVLHLCQRDDPTTGGAVQVAATLVQQLMEVDDIDAKLVFLYGEPGAFFDRLGDRCEYLRLRSSRDVPRYGFGLIRKMMRADIVHHHDMLTWSNVASLLAPDVKRVMHGHVFAGVRSFGWRTHLSNWMQTRRLSKFVAITEEVSASWLAAGVSRGLLAVVGNVVDFARYRNCKIDRAKKRSLLQLGDNDIVVGSVGRLHNVVKGTDDFVRTIAKLPPNYVGVIVGDGQDRDTLQQLVVAQQIENRIRFVGAVDNPESFYSAMDAFLFTSRFDGFGLTPLEAIAAGLPVFALKCEGGFNDWADDELMFRLADRDCDAMARLIQHSMISGAAMKKAVQGRAIAMRRFDASVVANNVADIYREIMARDVVTGNSKTGGGDLA